MVGDIESMAPDAGGSSRLREPEVENLDGAVGCQLDVGRLQVAMHDTVLVRGLERLRDLPRDRQCFVDRNAPFRNQVRERRAIDQLQHERLAGSRFFQPVNVRDVRMIERREHLRLALEPRDAIGIGREDIGKNLDRDVAVQPRIARAIHLAHATGPDGGEDFIWPETNAGRERHCLKSGGIIR